MVTMRKLEFEPIREERGEVCLSIYPPGEFINNKDWSVFVGGCGNGERKTLEAAKEFLLVRAVQYCDRCIQEAVEEIARYSVEKQKLLEKGLIEK